MNLIAAADENWGIGKNGGLLAHISGDMKYFRETTKGKIVVMGRKTLESFPGGKPLKNRVNIVLTGNKDFVPEYMKAFHFFSIAPSTIPPLSDLRVHNALPS